LNSEYLDASLKPNTTPKISMIVRLKSVSTIDIQIFCLVKLKANVDKQTKVLINTESKSDYINASYINVFFTFIS